MKIDEIKNKKTLILGFGKEGRDVLNFLKKIFPEKTIGIADQKKISGLIKKDKKIKFYSGKNYLKSVKEYDLIIKSPGIPISLPEIKKAYQQKKITSSTEIFFNNCESEIIGVTGTKGKGTTCSMIYAVLKQANIKAYLIGNMGNPGLNYLTVKSPEKKVYIYELSSHQLYNLKPVCWIAVFLNIFKDHLDYYKNFQEYFKAKQNIFLYQKKQNYLIYNYQDKKISEAVKKAKSFKIPIKGKYYELNKAAAIKVGQIFKIKHEIIEKALKNFNYSNHRLEKVGKFKGIIFYNDSAATIPEATQAALDLLKDKIETIILGGSEKNTDFNDLAKKIIKTKIKNLIFFPGTGLKINHAIVRHNIKNIKFNKFFVNNMMLAVETAYQNTSSGKICLLSPASASFGIFKDYQERGGLFKKYIKIINKKKHG